MTIGRLRSAIISIIFFGYVATVMVLIALWMVGGYDFDEFTTTVAVILPLIGVHIATIVAFTQNNPRGVEKDTEPVMRLTSSIALTVPTLFSTLMLIAIIARGLHLTNLTFEQFKLFLAVINSMFGAYVATLVSIYLKPQAVQEMDHSNKTLKTPSAVATSVDDEKT